MSGKRITCFGLAIGVAVAAEPETLATSAGAAVALGVGPVTVTLAPAAGKALSARVATAGEWKCAAPGQ